MFKTSLAVLLGLLALLLPGGASAAPALTMEQAVRQAVARAPELGAAKAAEESAASKVKQASSAYLPRVSLEATYFPHWPKNELPIEASLLPVPELVGEIDDYHRFRAGVVAGMRVLDLSRGPRVEAARASLRSVQEKTRETGAALAYQVRATFLAALFARDLKRIAGESLKLAQAEERRADLRAQVGTGSQLALAQARVRVADLRAQLRQAESELERYRRQLGSLLGERELPEVLGELEALAAGVELGGAGASPQVTQLEAARAAAERSAQGVSRTRWPTVGLMVRADVEYPHALQVEWGPQFQGAISLAWELFDGGQRGQQANELRAQASSLNQQRRATEERLGRKLIDLQARWRTAQADLVSARETLQQTEIYVRVARAAKEAGTGTDLDVYNAELNLDRVRVAVQRALLDQALARAESLMVHGLILEQRGGAR